MSGSTFFALTLGFVVLLNIIAIIIWFSYYSARKSCEANESPNYCYIYVCPNGTPATRISASGDIMQSGQGQDILDPSLYTN